MKLTRNNIAVLACITGFFAVVTACQKTDFPPSSVGEPRLFVRGTYNNQDVDFTIGNSSFTGLPEVIEDTGFFRTYNFTVSDNANPSGLRITLSFVNYASPFGLLNPDIDSTFKPGFKGMAVRFPSPANPLQLNTFTLSVTDTSYAFTSRLFFPDSSYCRIDSVSDLTWHDNITYKMVYLSFDCTMIKQQNPDSTEAIFSNGKAAIAFPKN